MTRQILMRLFFMNTLAIALLTCGVLFRAEPVQAEVARLTSIQPVVLPGNRVQVRFDFTLPPPLPQDYRVQQPPGLVLDFWGVENDTAQKLFPVQAGPLRSIDLGQTERRLRATVQTTQALPYRLFTDGNSLFLELNPGLSAGLGPLQPQRRQVGADSPPVATPSQLLGMEFDQKGEAGRVMLTLSDDRPGVDILEEGNNVLVNLLGADLSPSMEKRLELQQFGTPLIFLDAFSNDGNASVLVKPSAEPYDFRAWQLGRKLALEFHPLHLVDAPVSADQPPVDHYTGTPMSLNLQNVNVRAVLQMIAETAKRQLVVSETVRGEVSLRLLNVPWPQALDLVLEKLQLEFRPVGDVMLILSQQDVAALSAPVDNDGQVIARTMGAPGVPVMSDDEVAPVMELKKPVRKPISIRTEMMPVRYSKASELRMQLLDARLVTSQGSIQADDGAGMLVVKDTDMARARIRDVLSKLDVMVYKSMILETQLVAAPRNVAQQLGVRWSNVAPQANGLSVGFRQGDGMLDAELQLLEQQGALRVVSRTLKTMQSGDEVALERARELTPLIGHRGDRYQDVVMSVDVMSRIQQGGRILMDVNIARDVLSQPGAGGEISIANNELISSVVVPDGDALVLTGFLDQVRGASSDDSVLGNSSDNAENSGQDIELLIFITPVLAGSS